MNKANTTKIIDLLISSKENFENESIEKCIKRLRNEPENILILNELSELYEFKNIYVNAFLLRQFITHLQPKNALAKIKLARVMIKQNKFELAIDEYRNAINLMSDHPGYAYIELGDILERCSQLSDAILAYNYALKVAKNRGLVLGKLARITAKQGKFKEAAEMYQNAVASQANLPVWIYKEMGDTYDKLENFDQAINAYQQAVKLQPENKEFNYYLYKSKEQKKNTRELSRCNYRIISLGYDCLPRTIPTKWRLKKTKSQGELSCPFDLSVHPYESVCNLLNNDFSDYLNPDFLEKNISNDGNITIINTKYNCYFNHEKSDFWMENNFTNLIDRYNVRIDNFYSYVKNSCDNPILFVLHNPNKFLVPEKLIQIIDEKFINIKYKLLVINTDVESFDYVPSNTSIKNLIICNIPKPNYDYLWHQPKYFTSEEGVIFEKQLISYVKNIIFNNYFNKNSITENSMIKEKLESASRSL